MVEVILRTAFIFLCGLAAGVLAYDIALDHTPMANMPAVECIWITGPIVASNDLKKCYVIGYQWGRR